MINLLVFLKCQHIVPYFDVRFTGYQVLKISLRVMVDAIGCAGMNCMLWTLSG